MTAPEVVHDVVVVGGGNAGLVLAARLSENPAIQVVVLEAGEDKSVDPCVFTPVMWPMCLKSEIDWKFQTTKQPELSGRHLDVPAGRLLGGTSSINGSLFCPTSRSHLEAWAGLGNEGWGWDTFSKAVKKSVTIPGENDTSGPVKLRVPSDDEDTAWIKVWTETMKTNGYPTCDPFSGEVLGAAIIPEIIDPATGHRSSSASAHLQLARGRANLTVITGATVSRILFKDSDLPNIEADGIEYNVKQDDGSFKTIMVKARKEVILAAGAINSPRLLELSGIGNASLLKKLGIDVIVDNPHVGENLQNHILVGTNFEVKDESDMPSRSPFFRQEPDVVHAAVAAFSKGSGPMASTGTNAWAQLPFPGVETAEGRDQVEKLIQGAIPSKETSEEPKTTGSFTAAHEAFVHSVLRSPKHAPFAFGAINTFVPRDGSDPTYRPPGKHVFIGFLLAHPLSRGSSHITQSPLSSYSPSAEGVTIKANFLTHPLDTSVAAAGLRYIEDTKAETEPLASHLKPGQAKRFGDLEATREYIRRTVTGGNHWVGTCSMMAREMGGVVDPRLRVYGTKNLRVCDASIVPIVPRGNTMAVVYGLAERGAELIREDL